MASDSNSYLHKSRTQQQQLVSAMIKQGFISDAFLSPPPNFKGAITPTATTPNHSPTLFQMMSVDSKSAAPEAHTKLQDRVSSVLSRAPFRISDRWGVGDVRLTVSARSDAGEKETAAAFRVSMDVHRRVLAAKSRFFAEKLRRSGTHSVEILDCDDVAVYVEAVVLMYCGDELDNELLCMDVSKILTLLKISSAIKFDEGVRACLKFLEAVPWSNSEEENVISHLNELHLNGLQMDGVLQRVISDPSTSSRSDEIFSKLSLNILNAKDEKARKDMKSLISRLLNEDNHHNNSFYSRLDISRDTLYQLCHRCLTSLILCLSAATCVDEDRGNLMAEIAREADNMQWIVGILIDRKMGDDFVKLWADQKDLAVLHSKIPVMYRHEISKITAQLCVCIGQGKVLVSKEIRFGLLSTWLEALYDDFGWMRIGGRLSDRKVIEEGLSQTILTLPLTQQQLILMRWFDRFLDRGDDCPDIRRAFEVWWRRAFVKQYVIESRLQIAVYDVDQ